MYLKPMPLEYNNGGIFVKPILFILMSLIKTVARKSKFIVVLKALVLKLQTAITFTLFIM